MKEKVKLLLDWVQSQGPTAKVVVMIIITLCCYLLFFTSCSSIKAGHPVPGIAAEGVISKEKSVNRTTKWYYQPELIDSLTN